MLSLILQQTLYASCSEPILTVGVVALVGTTIIHTKDAKHMRRTYVISNTITDILHGVSKL